VNPTAVRQDERRQVILASARHLLRDHGWHGVAIDEIGAAAGLTGPAVYRYFDSKEALLTAAMSHAAEQLWSSLPEEGTAPGLEALVGGHVRFALDNADLVELWYREARHLPPDDLRAQRRLQRRYMEGWVDALTRRRPDVGTQAARIMVRAAIGLIHSVAHSDDRQDPGATGAILVGMALAALDSTPSGPAPAGTQPAGTQPAGTQPAGTTPRGTP
jgi:AcrR family transcriptional regulator